MNGRLFKTVFLSPPCKWNSAFLFWRGFQIGGAQCSLEIFPLLVFYLFLNWLQYSTYQTLVPYLVNWQCWIILAILDEMFIRTYQQSEQIFSEEGVLQRGARESRSIWNPIISRTSGPVVVSGTVNRAFWCPVYAERGTKSWKLTWFSTKTLVSIMAVLDADIDWTRDNLCDTIPGRRSQRPAWPPPSFSVVLRCRYVAAVLPRHNITNGSTRDHIDKSKSTL